MVFSDVRGLRGPECNFDYFHQESGYCQSTVSMQPLSRSKQRVLKNLANPACKKTCQQRSQNDLVGKEKTAAKGLKTKSVLFSFSSGGFPLLFESPLLMSRTIDYHFRGPYGLGVLLILFVFGCGEPAKFVFCTFSSLLWSLLKI